MVDRQRYRWTPEQDRYLLREAEKQGFASIAARLGRSTSAVAGRHYWLMRRQRDPYYDDLAAAFISAFKRTGMTHGELAQRAGYEPSRVGNFMAGRTRVSTRVLADFIEAAGLTFTITKETSNAEQDNQD